MTSTQTGARLDFVVRFHGPFGVATGRAAPGRDVTVNRDDPLPGSSLKGLMRDSARSLACDPRLADQVFGTAATASPWVWQGARPAGSEAPASWGRTRRVTRVSIDEQTHTAVENQIRVADVIEQQGEVVFTVTRPWGQPTPSERALIRVAAAAIHNLGFERRRGLGWVTVTPLDQDGSPMAVTADDVRLARGGSDRA